jgi:type I restriction enzyme S subunit
VSWPEAAFGDLYREPSRNGLYKASSFHGDGAKIVNMGELFAYERVGTQEMARIRVDDGELSRFGLIDGDLLFARRSLVESGAGRCVIVLGVEEPTVFESSLIRVRLDPARSDPRFYRYYLCTYPGRGRIQTIITGVSQKGIRGSELEQIRVHRPPISVQTRIADVLAAYDDLIENNRRRMALLEEAARLLYREWFVLLRFPGHEHSRIIKGVPEGWDRKPLADLCESVDYGYTASASDQDVGPRFLRITDIVPASINWPTVPYCEIPDDRLERFRLQTGDIVIARTGATVGYAKRLHKMHPCAVFASYLVRLRFRPDFSNLLAGVFIESDDYKAYVQSRVGGAAQPNANARVLAAAEILIPSRTIQHAFDDIVGVLIDQRELLDLQNQKLRAARDLLLPRLMSGEIAV